MDDEKLKDVELIKDVEVYFTPALRPPFDFMGCYEDGKTKLRLSVGLCNRSGCKFCQSSQRVISIGSRIVDLELVVKEGEPAPEGKTGSRKFYIAHNPRPMGTQVEQKKGIEEKDEFGFPKLPSLDIRVPVIPKGFKVIPLGHAGKIGAECFAYDDDKGNVLIVDCGIDVGYIESDGPALDVFGEPANLPNLRWIERNVERVRAILISHGHLDHIGALPYLAPEVLRKISIYATPFTARLILRQFRILNVSTEPKIIIFNPGEALSFGPEISVETIPVSHSIPETCSFVISMGGKRIVHFSDAKFNGNGYSEKIELTGRLRDAAKTAIDLLVLDVLNVREFNFTPQQNLVFESLWDVISNTPRTSRIVVSFFGSNIERMKAITGMAKSIGRKCKVIGKTMEDYYAIARDLGMIEEMPKEGEGEIYCVTGCQGEFGSCLWRLVRAEDTRLSIEPGDVVIISSRPIPGNDRAFREVVSGLSRLGAKVIIDSKTSNFQDLAIKPEKDLHVSGHSNCEDMKLAIRLLNPRQIYPVHANFYQIVRFRREIMEKVFPQINILGGEPGYPVAIG